MVLQVYKNPVPGSRLPYIIRLPVAGEPPLTLGCGAMWPGVKDVFCYQLDALPPGAELVEEVPVQSCWRAGKAVHLVLQRSRRRRSMFVWTQSRGRTLIFWRTQKTMQSARPGLKTPQARRLEIDEIAVDLREQYPWRFAKQKVTCVLRELPVGDYGVVIEDALVGAIERKSVEGLIAAATDGTLNFALAELSRLPFGALVVEGRLSDVFKQATHVNHGWLMSIIVALQVMHPKVNWIFAETRDFAEEYAYRWLAAVYKTTSDPGSAIFQGRFTGDQVAEAAPSPYGEAGPSESAKTALSASGETVPLPLRFDQAEGGAGETARTGRPVDKSGAARAVGAAATTLRDRSARLTEALRRADEGHIWTSEEYARYFSVTLPTAYSDLKRLVEAGSLFPVARSRPRRYMRRPPEDGTRSEPHSSRN